MDIVIFSQSFGAGEHGPLHRIGKPDCWQSAPALVSNPGFIDPNGFFWTGRAELLLIRVLPSDAIRLNQMSGSSSLPVTLTKHQEDTESDKEQTYHD
jgi:hypothetical protein